MKPGIVFRIPRSWESSPVITADIARPAVHVAGESQHVRNFVFGPQVQQRELVLSLIGPGKDRLPIDLNQLNWCRHRCR